MKQIHWMRTQSWATPATIGAFAVTGVTGIFMFFHLQTGWMKTAHEWVGWLAIAAVLFHALIHWGAFKRYFSSGIGLSVILVFVAVGLLSALPSSRKPSGNPMRQVIGIIEQTSLTAVSTVAGHTPEELSEQLKAVGIMVEAPNQSIRQIAQKNQRQVTELITLIFDSPAHTTPSRH